MSTHFERDNFNVSNQYGYKKGHSCETDILKGFDSNFAAVLLLFNLSAAFDTVNTNKLLVISRNEIGICGTAYDWFSLFLRDRAMSIKINNSYSEVHHLCSGVTQGSDLGPALFNIYIRSFYTLIENKGFEIKSFADDHQIYASFAPSFDHHLLVTKLNNIFSIVTILTSKYFLKQNPRKSQIIMFCTETLKRQLKINGFILDSHLNFEQQVNNCVSSIFASIKNFARLKYYLTKKELFILVSSLIVSKSDYCNSLYYDIYSSLLKKSNMLKIAQLD